MCDAALNDEPDPNFPPEANEESSDQNETAKNERFEIIHNYANIFFYFYNVL